MPCPYFIPVRVLENCQTWLIQPRLPLGDAYGGSCRAGNHEPEAVALETCCNRGYARGRCEHFPASTAEADAIRFSVEEETADRLRIVYIYELNYLPSRYGRVEYVKADGAIEGELQDPVVLAQLRVFAAEYRKRRITIEDGPLHLRVGV